MKTIPAPVSRPPRLFPKLFAALTLSASFLYAEPAPAPAECPELEAGLAALERERKEIAKEREATERLAREVLEALRQAGDGKAEPAGEMEARVAAAERARDEAQAHVGEIRAKVGQLEARLGNAEKARNSAREMEVSLAEAEAKAGEARTRVAALEEELNAFRNLAKERDSERTDFAKVQGVLRAKLAASEAVANKARAGLVEETIKRKKLESELERLKAKPQSPPEIAPARYSKNGDENAAENARVLHEVRAVLADFPEARFHLVGHTSSDAASSLNLELSIRRARNLAEFLVKEGIPEDRVSYEGLGEGSPVADNNTEEGRIQNRRVEIWVTN